MQDTVRLTLDSSLVSMVQTRPLAENLTTHRATPPRHDGLLRPVSTVSETFVFVVLLLLLFALHKVVRTGPALVWAMVKNLLFQDDRGLTRDAVFKRSALLFWPVNVFFISISAHEFLQRFHPEVQTDSWLFWKLALFTLLFLLLKNLVTRLVTTVFMPSELTRRLLQGEQVLLTVFSISLIPLLLLNEMGVLLPLALLLVWFTVFLIVPHVVFAFKGFNFFVIEHSGYVYIILYLCALEILPLLLFFKGIFLIQ